MLFPLLEKAQVLVVVEKPKAVVCVLYAPKPKENTGPFPSWRPDFISEGIFIHQVQLRTPANKSFYWKSTLSSPAPLSGMNDFPVIGIATAVPVIHLLLSFYSHLFPLFSEPAFFFLRKNMKQERLHGKGRKQRTLLMPSKNPERNIRFFTGVFYFP
ncbi:hypothetical protein [Akkermansia muciniphila]|jgi:hypothetical protein|uniref:hypothetical protein n=1 Tax=Akkermansia muciniphila TaxID=239935 RepID=UPI000AF3048F|nr:hypothetical protein [Akkermansia muciniphila]